MKNTNLVELFNIEKTVHTKKHYDIWVVKPKNRVGSENFQELKDEIESIGGYYSRYKRGFIFEKDPTELINESNININLLAKQSYAEQIEEKKERAERRSERYIEIAAKNSKKASEHFNTGRKMASIIPFGQPILVGHHSEKRDRNYRNKINNQYDKGTSASAKASYYQEKANGVDNAIRKLEDPEVTSRRIKRLGADKRKCERHLADYQYALKHGKFPNGWEVKKELAEREIERYNRLINDYEEKITYWKTYLKDIGYITDQDIVENTNVTLKFRREKIVLDYGTGTAYKTKYQDKKYTIANNYGKWKIYEGDYKKLKCLEPHIGKPFETLKEAKAWLQNKVDKKEL